MAGVERVTGVGVPIGERAHGSEALGPQLSLARRRSYAEHAQPRLDLPAHKHTKSLERLRDLATSVLGPTTTADAAAAAAAAAASRGSYSHCALARLAGWLTGGRACSARLTDRGQTCTRRDRPPRAPPLCHCAPHRFGVTASPNGSRCAVRAACRVSRCDTTHAECTRDATHIASAPSFFTPAALGPAPSAVAGGGRASFSFDRLSSRVRAVGSAAGGTSSPVGSGLVGLRRRGQRAAAKIGNWRPRPRKEEVQGQSTRAVRARACVRGYACVRMRACLLACLRACVRACESACVLVRTECAESHPSGPRTDHGTREHSMAQTERAAAGSRGITRPKWAWTFKWERA